MHRFVRLTLSALALATAGAAMAAPSPFSIHVDGVDAGLSIAAPQALCVPTADGKSEKIPDIIRPAMRWQGAPTGTKSFALFMMDPDVPADFSDAGKEGKIIAAEAKRQDFFHWGVVDIPADVSSIKGGLARIAPEAGRELPNDLGAAGYVPAPGSYGGPCPPWNDARVHHYHFIVLALDTPTADVTANETAKAAFARLIDSPHLLGKATLVGTYTLNAALRAQSE